MLCNRVLQPSIELIARGWCNNICFKYFWYSIKQRQPACCWLQGVLPECVMAGLYLLAFHVKFRPCLGSRQTVLRLWQCTSAFTWKFFKFCTQLPFWFVAKRWGERWGWGNHLKPRFHFCQVLIIKSFNLPNAPEQSTIIKSSSSNV